MEPINLEDLRSGFHSRPYNALVQHHIKRQGERELARGVEGTLLMLSPALLPAVEIFIDRWNARAYDANFWKTDCATIFDEIIEDARGVVRQSSILEDDETLFNMFQVVTLNFAASASGQPKMRKFAGIKKGWFS